MSYERPLGWGLIGASDIARTRMIEAIRTQPNSNVVAVMSSQIARAQSYAAEANIPGAYDALDAILSDPAVDVVYISTTNELTPNRHSRRHEPASMCCAKSRWRCRSTLHAGWSQRVRQPEL